MVPLHPSINRVEKSPRPVPRRRVSLSAWILPVVSFLIGPTCEPPPPAGPLHLIIDAGSSGTRLCVFQIQGECDADSGACACRAPRTGDRESGLTVDGEACRSIPEAPGLAGMSPSEAAATVAAGVSAIITPEIRASLRGAALLGTGGFRQIPNDEIRLRILEALESGIKRSLNEALPPGSAVLPAPAVRVLSGADEGRLAWLAVREIDGAQNHAILETGGASVQFATGRQGQVSEAVSLPVGINRAFERLQREADLSACYPFGAPDGATDFDRCRELIRRTVFSEAAAASLARGSKSPADSAGRAGDAPDRPGPLYGLGSAWKAIFMGMDRSRISLAELLHFGRAVCADRKLTEQERTSKYLKRRCYLYAFQSALLERTGYSGIHRGTESWPRGAAISKDFFPACKDPRTPSQESQ